MRYPKYVIVTGGVSSSLGKGIFTSSLMLLLKLSGYKVTGIKCDPYLNVDAGTMNPYQHGEVFVTYDGGETDLDIGHYERFLDQPISKDANITSGKVFLQVIRAEREGRYLGQTVTFIPHVTDMIKSMIRRASRDAQIAVVEIGGTVGDIEGLAFLEAVRQLGRDLGRTELIYVHITYVPYLPSADEFKTKPTQHSVKELMRTGIIPDLLVLRSPKQLPVTLKDKLSLYLNLPQDDIYILPDLDTIYKAPVLLAEQGLHLNLLSKLGLKPFIKVEESEGYKCWKQFLQKLNAWRDYHSDRSVRIALVGKYIEFKDAYISLLEALKHSATELDLRLDVMMVDARRESFESLRRKLKDADGILVPGGFGVEGMTIKLEAIRYAYREGVPFLGICLGFQLATIFIAREIIGLRDANSTEFDPETPYPIITLIKSSRLDKLGGTMHLGEEECRVVPDSMLGEIYGGMVSIRQRFRHRYELNPEFIPVLESAGVKFSIWTGDVPCALELRGHPFFVGVQFHPEFSSRPLRPEPVITAFLKSAHYFRIREVNCLES